MAAPSFEESQAVKRIIFLSSLVTSATWVVISTLAVVFVFPAIVDAQAARVRFDDVLVGADGHTQVHLGTLPTHDAPAGISVQLLNPDGTVRAQLASGGGLSNPDPAAAGLNVYYPNGSNTIMVRVGTAAPLDLPAMTLRDSQGTVRYAVSLDASGNASTEIFDADGNVIWSAP
jgi:hypothetical protein